MVDRGGFEPPKSVTTDLQSVPFGRSGTCPYIGAGDWNRTHNLLITSQLLCQLSYTSIIVLSWLMKPVKAYLTNAYVDLFKLHTSSTITSSRSLLTPSYHLGAGDSYRIRTDDLLIDSQMC